MSVTCRDHALEGAEMCLMGLHEVVARPKLVSRRTLIMVRYCARCLHEEVVPDVGGCSIEDQNPH